METRTDGKWIRADLTEEKRSKASWFLPWLKPAFFSPIGGQDNAFRRPTGCFFFQGCDLGQQLPCRATSSPSSSHVVNGRNGSKKTGRQETGGGPSDSAGRALLCLSHSKLGTAWTHTTTLLPVSPAALAVPGAPGGSRPETRPLFTGQRAPVDSPARERLAPFSRDLFKNTSLGREDVNNTCSSSTRHTRHSWYTEHVTWKTLSLLPASSTVRAALGGHRGPLDCHRQSARGDLLKNWGKVEAAWTHTHTHTHTSRAPAAVCERLGRFQENHKTRDLWSNWFSADSAPVDLPAQGGLASASVLAPETVTPPPGRCDDGPECIHPVGRHCSGAPSGADRDRCSLQPSRKTCRCRLSGAMR